MQTLSQDVRFASRMLIKNAGFSAMAVLTFAPGFAALGQPTRVDPLMVLRYE